jgi:glycosyltransferase involved in cell wall biosynthesis
MINSSFNGVKILAIDLEPTPYKYDLWNALASIPDVALRVIYTERKNLSKDAGHNYLDLPKCTHQHFTIHSSPLIRHLKPALYVLWSILRQKYDIIYIAGYDRLYTYLAILAVVALRKRFAVHADQFNLSRPTKSLFAIASTLRSFIRRLIFNRSCAVLVCGTEGFKTALLAGCPREKIRDFPYVIDIHRIRNDSPPNIPAECINDLKLKKMVIYYSGRMIARKGLSTLLVSFSQLGLAATNSVIWIEGDGHLLNDLVELSTHLNIKAYCRFLGFCQYQTHSWLIRNSDIVIVPSLFDSWGIVVDEGLQLNKVVIASNRTGSATDIIQHKYNGFLFSPGDSRELTCIIRMLIKSPSLRALIARNTANNPKNKTPLDNARTILRSAKEK